MAEQSYIFDFSRVDDFFENFNIKFSLSDMWKVTGYNETTGEYIYDGTGSEKFELVITETGGNNIEEYLDSNGRLDTSTVSGIHTMSCALDWYNRGDGEGTIELHNSLTFEIGEANISLKSILLRDATTGYIMGYSINDKPFSLTNELVFDDDVIFWDISRFRNGG